MGGGNTPQDNSHFFAAIEAQAAREAREHQVAEEAKDEEAFLERMNGAYQTGVLGAEDYFTSRGLDPNDYATAIQRRAQAARSSVPLGDPAPGVYFENLGQQVYEAQQEAARSKALRGLDQVAPTGFASKRITNDVDDNIIEAILAEQRAEAQQYNDNLRDRGVITSAGYDGANKALEKQLPGARSRLDEIALGLLEGGRGGASNIANDARSQASNLQLGSAFDPYATGTELNSYFQNFFEQLGGKYRAAAPSDLFTTAGLANAAGVASGAQNTAFDPRAIAGIFEDDDEDDDSLSTGTSPF